MEDTEKYSAYRQWAYIINHIFLPPQLPQEDDYDIAQEHALCAAIEDCAGEYAAQAFSQRKRRWNRMRDMLGNLRRSHETVSLTADHVNESLAKMKDLGKAPINRCFHQTNRDFSRRCMFCHSRAERSSHRAETLRFHSF